MTCKHKWDEFHMYEVLCSICRTCREYTSEDLINLEKKKKQLQEEANAVHRRA